MGHHTKMVNKIHGIVKDDKRVMVLMYAEAMRIAIDTVIKISHNYLDAKKLEQDEGLIFSQLKSATL